MTKLLAFYFLLLSCLLSPLALAQEATTESKITQVEKPQEQNEPLSKETTPQVGKHVMANMNAGSMILSLLMVLGLIIISAIVLKRFNLTQQNSSQLKVVANLSLGAKERIMVVQVGEQQLVLGVSPQQISLLTNLETPIEPQMSQSLALSGNVLSFLNKNKIQSSNTKQSTSEIIRNK